MQSGRSSHLKVFSERDTLQIYESGLSGLYILTSDRVESGATKDFLKAFISFSPCTAFVCAYSHSWKTSAYSYQVNSTFHPTSIFTNRREANREEEKRERDGGRKGGRKKERERDLYTSKKVLKPSLSYWTKFT